MVDMVTSLESDMVAMATSLEAYMVATVDRKDIAEIADKLQDTDSVVTSATET